ncbi:similar to Kazachstania naganishii KNAG_0E01100 hypothetical protein [Maudiozyma saulgeensis]|uniref:Major facilitator superfamily (MFS) profile domain-containing protein n=1 Tax=Maudiozyma saulgeensis TaxID=1789683 RepID=A0A1X7QYT4_9SACH|nr:similar to Kazachstania naganishii KNAG_0E01100 hypothetical protein [Kazachstania saulgeensis]
MVQLINNKHLTHSLTRDIPRSFKEFKADIISRHQKECIILQPSFWDKDQVSPDIDYEEGTSSEIEESKPDNVSSNKINKYTGSEKDPVQGGRLGKYWSILTCGAGLFSDGYINNSISTVSTCLSKVYGKAYTESNAIKNVASIVFVGTVVGQLVFGYAADHYSRKASMLVGTVFLVVFAIMCGGAWGIHTTDSHPGGLFAALTIYRFFLGIGIGSEYSSGSPAAAEAANCLPKRCRNRWFIWFTNLAINCGSVVGAFVPLVLVWICGEKHLTPVWRISLGMGAICPMILFFLRLRFKESEAFEKTKFTKGLPYLQIIKFYWYRCLIISVIWFLYDFSAYGFGTYSSIIIGLVLPKKASLAKNFGWHVVLTLFKLPGSYLGAYSSDYFGARFSMTIGLLLHAALGFGIGGGLKHLTKHIGGFVVIYGVFSSLDGFSAGDNIGYIAASINATPVRGTLYGVAAMVGKIGAFVGSYIFPSLIKRHGLASAYYVCSALAVFSAFLTYFCLPELDKEAMDREDILFKEYLESQGYDITLMGLHRNDLEDSVIDTNTASFEVNEDDTKDEHKHIVGTYAIDSGNNSDNNSSSSIAVKETE